MRLRWALGALASLLCIVGVALGGGVLLAHSDAPKPDATVDVFGLSELASLPRPNLPPLLRYPARDGAALPYRFYDARSDRILILLHGSSYHGGGYHLQAHTLSVSDTAKIVLPNLRGHFQSGDTRGDVSYIGQLEDDIADLIGHLRERGHDGPVFLAGHSSGGGLALRFAGGQHRALVESYLLLAPAIPGTPALAPGAGGWATLHWKRLVGLLFLNQFGVHRYDGLPIIAFNVPEALRDGSETLSYSHRLNLSYHPRRDLRGDLKGLAPGSLVIVGGRDEAVDAKPLAELVSRHAPAVEISVIEPLTHFGILRDAGVLANVQRWLRTSQ